MMTNRVCSSAWMLAFCLLVGTNVYAQRLSFHGRIVTQYMVKSNMMETPLANVLVQLKNTNSSNVISIAVTDSKGVFYFYDIPKGEYNIEVHFGKELLILTENIMGEARMGIQKTYLRIKLASNMQDLGVIVIRKDAIQSLK